MNVRTAAIFACKDGGIGVDPVPRLRRPVTRFGVGTILDGTGTGGGLEIVESGGPVILWEVGEEREMTEGERPRAECRVERDENMRERPR